METRQEQEQERESDMEPRDPAYPSDDLTRRAPTTPPVTTGGQTPLTQQGSQSTSDSGSVTDRVSDTASVAKEKVGDVTHAARDQVADKAHTAKDAVDAQRDTVAGGLDTVASQLRDRAGTLPGGERTTQVAETAAMRLEDASGYLRDHDVNDMMTDLERMVRSHPKESLIVALAAGFLVGRMIKS